MPLIKVGQRSVWCHASSFPHLTWPPVSLFHPNVAVALSHAGLRVKKRHPDAPLGTEPGVVVMTLLHGISVVLLSQPDSTK